MTLKQLEAFYWAATCASFALAAQRVHLSVSSLSKRISELEAFLAMQLFDRSGRRARLTPEGEQLLPQVRALLQAADRLAQSAGSRPEGLQGRCRFGVGELTSLTWLPRLVAAARAEHPDLQMEPRIGVGQALEQGVESGDLDFAIVAESSTRSAIASHFIGRTCFLWVAAPGLCPRGRLAPGQLREHHFITLPEGAGTTRILDRWFTAHPQAHGGRRLTCEQWGAAAGLLRQGLGVGILPEGWARALAARGDLLVLEGMPPLDALSYTFQWRRDDTRALVSRLRPLAEAAVDFSAPNCLL